MSSPTVPSRGSVRSRSAATVSFLTLRQLSAVLPPVQFWGLWASRQLVAGIMETFGPPTARVVGEWVHPPESPHAARAERAILRTAGSDCQLQTWLSPEATPALTAAAQFITTALERG